MMTNSTLLGAVDNKRTYFVGDFSPVVFGSGSGLAEWVPDELRVETRNKVVTMKYVDEVERADSKRDEAKESVESVVSKPDEVKSVVSKRRILDRWFRTHS